jgi:hypothetical protein
VTARVLGEASLVCSSYERPAALPKIRPSSEKPMLEYLNVDSGWRTAPSRTDSSSNASLFGNGRPCVQKVASTPSRVTPAEFETSSRTETLARGEPASVSSGSHAAAVLSSRSLPASTSCMTAVAVEVLECEATRKRCAVVSLSPVSRFETPCALLNWTVPLNRTATCAPGTRSFQRRYSSQEST